MNILSIENRQNKYYPDYFYDDIKIDGIFIDEWFAQFKPKNSFDIDIEGLTPPLDLFENKETERVWHYLGQLQPNDKYFVPILTCPDDLDLSCSVVMVEQSVTQNLVIWSRFGFLLGELENQNPNDIEWFGDLPTLTFDKQNFIQTYQHFLIQTQKSAQENGRSLNIKMPADPPKQDWELIIDSWSD